MQLYYKAFQSPLGWIGLLASPQGLQQVFWNTSSHYVLPFATLKPKYPILQEAEKQIKEYFEGRRKQFSLCLDLRQGTSFQRKAWHALQKIPYGQVISYQKQAGMMGCYRGYRAVGNANGKNPIPIIIPCHRVIRKSSETKMTQRKMGGFTGGIEKKAFLLQLEGTLVH